MIKPIPEDVRSALVSGAVIPALPLALNRKRKLDERRQRTLIRYYLDAGAGGVAVGVHTTQFAIRSPEINLYSPLLEIAAEEFSRYTLLTGNQVIRIAGVIGKKDQALKEANTALKYGYHAALLGLGAFKDSPNSKILRHCHAIAEVIPIFGFYLQPAAGGRILDIDFWREFAAIQNVVAIKIAPFNRYQTLDVVRGVIESGRASEIALYTGNDDNILVDLLSEYRIPYGGKIVSKRISGGLLGHWAVWTRTAVKLLNDVHSGEFDHDIKKTYSLRRGRNHFIQCLERADPFGREVRYSCDDDPDGVRWISRQSFSFLGDAGNAWNLSCQHGSHGIGSINRRRSTFR